MIHHSRPYIGTEEQDAVLKVLRSRNLAGGRQLATLECELARKVGHAAGIGFSSGTAALYVALGALGIKAGDKIVVPVYACTALLNAITMARGEVVLADVDPEHGNVTEKSVREAISKVKRVRAIIAVHMFGYPADIGAIAKIGLPIIEDCAQCVGATRDHNRVGGQSEMSIFSFYATKLIAAGEGGMLATSDKRIAERALDYREYDKRDHYTPAFNLKMPDIGAAIARAQLRKLRNMIACRRANADAYRELLRDADLLLPPTEINVDPVYFRFVVQVKGNVDSIVGMLRKQGIETARPVFKTLHRYLSQNGFPVADVLHKRSISLPVHPGLTKGEIRRVARSLSQILHA